MREKTYCSDCVNVLIAGNPNVGKSVVFSRLTGINVITSNYPGTTISFTEGFLNFQDKKYRIADVPGIYTLEPVSKAEEVAVDMLRSGEIIVNVLDATNLERNLNLTLQILKLGKPMILVLNFWDETKHTGIKIDVKKLEDILGVPVIPTCAVTGEGLREVISQLSFARASSFKFNDSEKWQAIGGIIEKAQTVFHKHHTLLERLSDITIAPVTGLPAALGVLFVVFNFVRFIGEGLIETVLEPAFTNYYMPFILRLFSSLKIDFLRGILLGNPPVVMESFGVLLTGVYVPVVVVFPYILSFYIVLSFLEDFGYLPRLAVLLDNFFHRLGLHGYSAIPVMLGLGCKVPAILSTRILESKREKIITIILILMSAPCMPQTAMIFSMGARYGMKTVGFLLAIIFITALIISYLFNMIMKGDAPELFIEIPPYRMPNFQILSKKIWLRIKDFFMEAMPMIILGIFLMGILDILGITAFISSTLARPISYLLGLPREIAAVMILGFLRKDVSIAVLAPFNLSAKQFVVAGIFLVMYLPCVASFFMILRELGIRTALKIIFAIFIIALSVGSLLNLFL
ncbi:MAG: Ferrous iron transport protein B [Elusimicrobia bacterium ADurb.Bin231]|nr:MAG: Ferrous iron transport protein B [Elusimicrobia bacterium ADurb.Bin231]